MVKKRIISTIAALILIGCSATHNFHVQFSDIQGLKKGDPIFFDETPVGTVVDVEYTDQGDYLVGVAVDKKFVDLPKDASTFYIDSAPDNASQKAVRIIQIQGGQ
jgi:hypothetical protein